MNVLSNSWRCSLVATAMWTMLAAAPAPAAAQSEPGIPAAATANRAKIEQQMRAIREKMEKAMQAGKPEEVQRLQHEARALYSKIDPHAIAVPGGFEREQFQEQMRALHEKIERAMQAGNPEEVQRLRQAAEALRARLDPQGGYVPGGPQPGGEREARLQHLRAAAENLMAAGAEGEARHIMEIIQRMQAEGSSASVQEMRELRRQMEQMHREIRELRDELNRLKNSEHK